MSLLSSETSLLHYRIVEKIGRGGMGEVYRGWDTKIIESIATNVKEEKLRTAFVTSAAVKEVVNTM